HSARLLQRLLAKPDEWLGANLVFPTPGGAFASATATLRSHRSGSAYAWPMPIREVLLTIVLIGFCELAPKIYAASNPEGVALHAAGIYRVLVLVTRPALWLTSNLAYGLLRL